MQSGIGVLRPLGDPAMAARALVQVLGGDVGSQLIERIIQYRIIPYRIIHIGG